MFSKELSLTVSFFVALILLLLNCALSLQSLNTLVFNNSQVAHTYEVRLQLRDVVSLMKDAETGQRGYLLTGDERYLEPYNDALDQIDDSVGRLQNLILDNPDQLTRLEKLLATIKTKIAEMKETISIRRNQGFDEAQAVVLSGEGKRQMDEFRAIVQEIREEELKIFSQRLSQKSIAQQTALSTLIFGGLVNLGLVGFLYFYIRRDFARRAQNAEKLRTSQELTQATINALSSHIAVLNKEGTIIALNKAWNRFAKENSVREPDSNQRTGIGVNYLDICKSGMNNSITDAKIAFEGISKVMKGEETEFHFEYPCQTQTELKWFLMMATPLQLKEELGAVVSHTDITYLKNLEQEREQILQLERTARTELENLNQSKDEFLATISHELRTPLNAILGWATILKDAGLDEETQKRALEAIERNARIQVQLIEDLLDISRIIAGKLKIENDLVNPVESLNEALDSVSLAATAKEIEIRLNIQKTNILITGDHNRLQQVFWNLLLNAIKFTPHGGIIEVAMEKTASTVKFTVQDNGIGISPKLLPQIFERFQQVDGSITRRYGGLGIGLAIVKNLVELHGGTIEAISEGIGKGTKFVIHLPLNKPFRELS